MLLIKKNKVFMLVLLLSIVITFPVDLIAQVTFERTYGGTDAYTCYSVEQTSDGGYLAAGYINHIANSNYDFYLMKTDAYGDTLWTRFYDNQPIDICFSMQLTSDGGCIMAGYTGVWPDYKALLIKTDAVGDTLWTRSYTCADATIGYFGQSVQQTSDGEYIITGYTGNADYSNDIFLIKTNSYGDTLWTQIYDKNEYDIGNSVKQTSDGGFIIAGKTAFMWYSYVFLIKTDAEGDTLWTQTYGDADSQEGTDIQLTSDGGYIICGNVTDENTYTKDVYLIKTDGSGQLLWNQSYGSIYDEFANSVQKTADGGYVIAGYTVNYPIIDIYLVKTDVLGDTLWTRSYGDANMEYGYSVQQTADEGYIIGGYSNNQSTSRDEVYLLKTDENGIVSVLNSPQNLYVTEEGYATWDAPTPKDLLGYNVYLDGDSVEYTTDLFYQYEGLINEQTYIAGVSAVYDEGESVIVEFEFTYYDPFTVNMNVFLEGPFNGTDMNTHLNPADLPLTHPYGGPPWNYSGTESVASIPNTNIVDWVLVELRDTTEAQYAGGLTIIARQAAFLLNDGSIVGLDGTSFLKFNVPIENSLFAVVWHRNHLGVLSANALTGLGNVYFYNFTTGADKAYGGASGHKEIGTGTWGMIASDGNADGSVNLLDKDVVWAQQAGEKGYKSGDYNLNGQVNNPDKDDFWVPNEGNGSQVPE
ncbi:MAG: hypothetical protein H8D45_03470 [Bacteroidetes bacterium]|nr:hypothetical protein [Bacteroidota bacterium]